MGNLCIKKISNRNIIAILEDNMWPTAKVLWFPFFCFLKYEMYFFYNALEPMRNCSKSDENGQNFIVAKKYNGKQSK